MPSLEAQVALIKHVYESNGLDFGSTQYVEAHGTGTKAVSIISDERVFRTRLINKLRYYFGGLLSLEAL